MEDGAVVVVVTAVEEEVVVVMVVAAEEELAKYSIFGGEAHQIWMETEARVMWD
jgi:hypothetical protein